MVGTMRIAGAHTPNHLPEHEHKEQEENARYLENEDAADAAERAHKATQSPGDIGCCFSCLPSRIALSPRPADTCNRDRLRSSRARIANGTRQALPRQAPRHAKPNSQHPANGLRSHPVYDGSSDGRSPLPGKLGNPAVALPAPRH